MGEEDEHKISWRNYDDLFGLLVNNCAVGTNPFHSVILRNIYIIGLTVLVCIQKFVDVSVLVREHLRDLHCVQLAVWGTVFSSHTIRVVLVDPVCLSVDIKPLLELVLAQSDEASLLLGVVCKPESSIPVPNHLDWCWVWNIVEVFNNRRLLRFGLFVWLLVLFVVLGSLRSGHGQVVWYFFSTLTYLLDIVLD